MSIFKDLVDNVSFALNKKKMRALKTNQIEIINLNKQLVNLSSELQDKTTEITNLNNKLIETLEKHDSHQQTLHAKKGGFKSAFQYKMKIKSDISDNEQKRKSFIQQGQKYQDNLKKSQAELTKINNTILFYNNLKATTILVFLTSLLTSLSYILLAINPNFLYKNSSNFVIYSIILSLLILTSTTITFFLDKALYKKLKLGKLNFYNYTHPILLIANILLANMPLITAKPYILFAVYLVFAILILIILIKNEITFKKNKNYCFPLDFTIFNLPFINFTAVTIINSSLVNNNILSLIIKITYVICVLIYIILFVWDAITNQNKKKDFRQYIFLTISILMLFAYVLCAVLNFIPSIPQAIELIAGIGGIISLFSLLYQGFRKSSSKIDDKET